MTKLYYIENEGCDATTCGLVRISDEDFPKFRAFVENLNKSSHYGCMPVIWVFEIDEEFVIPCNEPDDDTLYIGDDDKLWLDGTMYTLVDGWRWSKHCRCVIEGRE